MSDSTVKTAVEFGEKASFSHKEPDSCSTIAYIDEMVLAHSFSYGSGSYKTVDYTDKKKMDTYRKVNKMLGGK